MKKIVISLFVSVMFLKVVCLSANETLVCPIVSNMSLSAAIPEGSIFGGDCQSHARKAKESYSTAEISYQYTTDGWLQHVATYPGSVICTNVAGPREGTQFIITHNGALVDMCHSYKKHKDHFVNKYSWCEVKTYENYQVVEIK